MKSTHIMEEAWREGMVVEDGKTLEQLLHRYEILVHSLAMHIIGDEAAADKVTLEVFLRLSQEHHKFQNEPLDNIIHRFTYDAALPALLERMEDLTEEVDIFGFEFAGEESRMVC